MCLFCFSCDVSGTEELIRRTAIVPTTFRSSEDEAVVRKTLHEYNDGCQIPSDELWPATGSDSNYTNNAVQSKTYDKVRSQTGLGSQHAILATHQAAQAIRGVRERRNNDKKVSKPEFTANTIRYDPRTLTLFEDDSASLATIDSRVRVDLKLPQETDGFQREFIEGDEWVLGESTLVIRDEQAYLHLGFKKKIPNAECMSAVGNGTVLGVDLNATGPFAVTSTGCFIGSSDELNHERREYEKRRGDMQEVGTRSAHLAIQSIGDRFANWSLNWLHHRANELIEEAKQKDVDGIAFERLTDIRDAISNGKKFQQWAFAKFIGLVRYKAKAAGIWVDTIGSHYTSQECSECGHTTRANRSGKEFDCVACHNRGHADYDAAKMVAKKYMRLHAERTSQGGGAVCQPALKSGQLPVDATAVFAVAWEPGVTDKPRPQQSEHTVSASD